MTMLVDSICSDGEKVDTGAGACIVAFVTLDRFFVIHQTTISEPPRRLSFFMLKEHAILCTVRNVALFMMVMVMMISGGDEGLLEQCTSRSP
jgi:hypothetical protein